MRMPTITHCRQDTKMRAVISLPDCAKIVWYAYFKKTQRTGYSRDNPARAVSFGYS